MAKKSTNETSAEQPKKIVLPDSVMDWIDNKSKDDGKRYSAKEGKLSLKEVKELKANLSLLRSHALYLMDISVYMGRGTSNIALELKDVIVDEERTSVLQDKNVKTTIRISKLLSDAATKLRTKRAKIINDHFKKFGEIFVCPAEELEAVQEKIQELYNEAEKQKEAVYNLHSEAYRIFLVDIAEIGRTNGYEEEQILTLLEKYAAIFPSKSSIKEQIQVIVTPPIKLPSIEELIQKDSVLQQAEAERAIAQTKLLEERTKQELICKEADSVRKLKEMAEAQMREHIGSVVNAARGHFVALVEQRLTEMLEKPPVNNMVEQRKFQQAMAEMQVFLEHQDESLQSMFGEMEELQRYFDGSSSSADARKENLLNRIQEIYQKYEPKFTSAKVAGRGHRAAALDGMEL